MTLEPGSLILADYTAKVKDTGDVIETTLEEEAKKLGIHDPARRYEPRLICVGEGWVLKGVDEALLSAEVEEELDIEVPPEKGFGERDPGKVRMIPLRRLGERAGELRVGDEVEVDNRKAIIRYIGSGRAQIDFNPRLAGKTLIYRLKVVKKLETPMEKVVALIKRRLPIDRDKVDARIRKNTLRIRLPDEYYLTEGLQVIKRAISADMFRFVDGIDKVEFIETYESERARERAEPPKARPRRRRATKKAATRGAAKVSEERSG